jgi:hypothetical protein
MFKVTENLAIGKSYNLCVDEDGWRSVLGMVDVGLLVEVAGT